MSLEWQGTTAVLLFAITAGFLFEAFLRYRDRRISKDVIREIREESDKRKKNAL